MHRALALPLTLVLLARFGAAAPDLASLRMQVETVPPQTTIEVVLKDQRKLRGHVVSYSDAGFRMSGPRKSVRPIAYDDVASLRQVERHVGETLGIVAGGAVAVVLVFLFILNHHSTLTP